MTTPTRELANTASIYIPPGPRLGDVVIEAKNIRKAYGDKLLMNDLSFTIPAGAIVGVVGKVQYTYLFIIILINKSIYFYLCSNYQDQMEQVYIYYLLL